MRLAGRPIPLARSANGRGRLRPWVALDADGYAYGDTGCMAFTGTWQRRGGALRVAIGESLGEADCGGDARRDAVSSAWLGTLAHGLIVRRSGSVDAGRIGVLVRPQAVRHPRRSGTFVGMRFDRVLALPSGPAWRVGRQEGSWPADLDGSGIGLPDCGGYDLVVVDGYVVEDAAVACPDIGVSPDLLA